MHKPRPYGLLAVGGELTDEDAAAVELLARRLTNLRQLSGVESLRMVRSLPNGGYVIAQDMGGTFRCISHKPAEPPPPEFDGIAVDYIPMLFSGVVAKSVVAGDAGIRLKLSQMARKRISNYKPGKLAPKEVALQRFRVGYGQMVYELAPQDPTTLFYSQYAAQRPTWYSGAMAEVMQIVGGYGRQKLKDLPDDPIERATMKIPDTVMATIKQQMGNVRLPGYTGLPHSEGQFRYDYKFNNTHGVGFDTDQKPWLIGVKTDGVWAMPLPLIPATTTEAFRDYVDSKEDNELLAILDRFGGMPSGETFPVNHPDFHAWRRAGVIIKICDVADFYDHIAYSSACGWSFNSKGSEGYNTCYDYYDDKGVGYGLAYKLSLRLSPTESDDKLPPIANQPDPIKQKQMNAYLGSLFELLENDAKGLAIKYKLRSVDPEQIMAKAGDKATESDVDYWDNLELPPIATHSGSIKEVGRGYLYSGENFSFQPQIKYPEPFMGGCVSHDFLPLPGHRHHTNYPNSDAIMFGYYIGDQLRVVKYFRDGGSYNREVESDFGPCMAVGSWTETVTEGQTSLAGYFYTTDIDDRKALSPSVQVTHITGKDKGYDSKPFFEFDAPFWRPGTLTRNRYYITESNTHRVEGQTMSIAICIPYLCRNAILHAKRETNGGTSDSHSIGMGSVQDPYSYRFWTNHPIFAWIGGLPVQKGDPYPKNGNPVWVEMEVYSESQCADFANSGPWIPGLPADYGWLIHPGQDWKLSGGGGPPSFKPSSSSSTTEGKETGELQFSMLDDIRIVFKNKPPNVMYFLGSPDPLVGVFYRDACQVVFGDAVYASISEAEGGSRKYYGKSVLADHTIAHHFIGVINE